jgi:hypothetical protein
VSYVSTDSGLSRPRPGHVWRDEHGIYATVRLDGATLCFDSAADARAVAAACSEAAEAIERLHKEGETDAG